MKSRKAKKFQYLSTLSQSDNGDVAEGYVDDSTMGKIPSRYQDGRGGIDLERVRLDQHEARRQVIRVMIRRIQKLWW